MAKDELEYKLLHEATELINGRLDLQLIWDEAFKSYLEIEYERYHDWWEARMDKNMIGRLINDGYWYANKKVVEYLTREFDEQS